MAKKRIRITPKLVWSIATPPEEKPKKGDKEEDKE